MTGVQTCALPISKAGLQDVWNGTYDSAIGRRIGAGTFNYLLMTIGGALLKGKGTACEAVESGSNTVNPKDVNFMQSSIKNQTGEHTVLGNAEALKSGALKATDLPEIRIWQDADGKLWTLDHRRLAAFRMAELDSVPFRWATDEEVANQMWKMTTKTNGISIKLKLADGQSMTIQ